MSVRGKAIPRATSCVPWISCVRLGARGAPPHKSNTTTSQKSEKHPQARRVVDCHRRRRYQQDGSHQRVEIGGDLCKTNEIWEISADFVRFLKQNFVEIHRKDDQDDKLGSFVTDRRTDRQTRFIVPESWGPPFLRPTRINS